MKIKNLISLGIIIFMLALLPNIFALQAQEDGDISGQIKTFGGSVYGQDEPAHPAAIAATMIKAALGILGIVFVVLVVYGGFLYMTSSGEADKVKKAKNVIMYAAIGVIIIFVAYALTNFIFGIVLQTTTGGGDIAPGPSGG